MNITKKTAMVIALAGILMIFSSFGNTALSQENARRHQGPPPEAFTACEGKSAGDTVTGTCEEQGDQLVLRPDNPPGRRNHNTSD